MKQDGSFNPYINLKTLIYFDPKFLYSTTKYPASVLLIKPAS